ncbi:hypothetical protein PR048_019380 [Dryococelus australis]|uniref:Uncharacterized protein n=1 Tax=Dryococelus australis TaxID=614101 RepID=A0ABQ9H3C6_9NEOP|nr:hypothetical protein PR048_019380 [Dryococelus australis]
MLPRTNTGGPMGKAVKQPHTITLPPPNFLVGTIHSGRSRSPGRRHTHARPSDRNNLNLDSSLYRTDFHCSSVHLRRSKHHLRRRALLLVVIWGQCTATLPKYPRFCDFCRSRLEVAAQNEQHWRNAHRPSTTQDECNLPSLVHKDHEALDFYASVAISAASHRFLRCGRPGGAYDSYISTKRAWLSPACLASNLSLRLRFLLGRLQRNGQRRSSPGIAGTPGMKSSFANKCSLEASCENGIDRDRHAEPLPDFRMRESCLTMPLVLRIFSRISRFPRHLIPALFYTYLASPSSARDVHSNAPPHHRQLSDVSWRHPRSHSPGHFVPKVLCGVEVGTAIVRACAVSVHHCIATAVAVSSWKSDSSQMYASCIVGLAPRLAPVGGKTVPARSEDCILCRAWWRLIFGGRGIRKCARASPALQSRRGVEFRLEDPRRCSSRDRRIRVGSGRCHSLWSGAGMRGRGKREIPEKTRRPATSSGTIPSCEYPVARPGIEPDYTPRQIGVLRLGGDAALDAHASVGVSSVGREHGITPLRALSYTSFLNLASMRSLNRTATLGEKVTCFFDLRFRESQPVAQSVDAQPIRCAGGSGFESRHLSGTFKTRLPSVVTRVKEQNARVLRSQSKQEARQADGHLWVTRPHKPAKTAHSAGKCRLMPLVRRRSIFTSITYVGSQDLAFKSRSTLFTHSLIQRQEQGQYERALLNICSPECHSKEKRKGIMRRSGYVPKIKDRNSNALQFSFDHVRSPLRTQLRTKVQFSECFNLGHRLTWRDTAASDSAMASEGHVHQSAHPCPNTQIGIALKRTRVMTSENVREPHSRRS